VTGGYPIDGLLPGYAGSIGKQPVMIFTLSPVFTLLSVFGFSVIIFRHFGFL